jgi:hypothetical protein
MSLHVQASYNTGVCLANAALYHGEHVAILISVSTCPHSRAFVQVMWYVIEAILGLKIWNNSIKVQVAKTKTLRLLILNDHG